MIPDDMYQTFNTVTCLIQIYGTMTAALYNYAVLLILQRLSVIKHHYVFLNK